jgi:formylglycine-generating enzyme required for sulfatase activity
LAGLVPAWCDRVPGCRVAVMTPGRDPLGQLAVALVSESREPRLLVVDQFEELFTLTSDEVQRRLFVERLLALATQHPVVLTMRAEFWGDCAPYPQLRETMQAHQALVAPMTPDELRSAMEQQAAVVGLRFEADLAQTLLDDVTGEPGAMPLLQHALLELWKRRRGRWLRTAEYRALGGVSQAIAGTAEAVYTALTPPERQQVRGIFLRLVRLDDQDAQRDTRRRVALDELVTQGSDRASVVRLVTRLADEKLLVTQANPVSGHDEVELAHEALVERWERLRAWITQDRQAISRLQDLSRAAKEWDERKRPGGLLLHDPLLHEARALQASDSAMLNPLETQFLMASQRQQRMNRMKLVALLSPFVVIPLLLLLAALLRFDLGPPKESGWLRVTEWEQASAGIGQYGAFVTVDPTDSRLVYAADRSKGGMYQSSDGGSTWQEINHPVLQDSVVRSLAVARDGTLIAATSGCAFEAGKTRPAEATGDSTASSTPSCLFVSRDRARSWQPIPLPVQDITPGAYLSAVTVDPEDPQRLFLGLWHDGVWQTTDSGSTWQRLSSLQDLDASHLIRALAAVDGELFIATEKGLYRMPTSPAAAAAPERIEPPASITVSALAIDPQTGDILVGTRGNGTWRVNETEWLSQSTYGDATAFTFSVGPGRDVLYAGTNDQGLLRRETRHWWQSAWWGSADITQTVVTEFPSGAPQGMVWVPAGEFEMGTPQAARLVYVEEFFIHANEISQEAYCAQSTCPGADAARAMYPKVDVSGRQAAEFCTGQGYRLPTEPEWEKAARGPDGRKFPWGDAEPTTREANLYYDNMIVEPATGRSRRAAEVDAWPLNEHLAEQQSGISPYGLRHMCGNVSEITNSAVSTKEFLVLGAGYTSPPQWSATYHREKDSSLPATSSGFRCVSVPNR